MTTDAISTFSFPYSLHLCGVRFQDAPPRVYIELMDEIIIIIIITLKIILRNCFEDRKYLVKHISHHIWIIFFSYYIREK